jgi:hypothetical protein
MPDASPLGVIEDEISLLRIGHSLAGHRPDIPALIWTDGRLVDSTIDNTQRFLDAARHLFAKLHAFRHPDAGGIDLAPTLQNLSDDLAADIGPSRATSTQRDPARIERYHRRALSADYGGMPMPEYRIGKWADDAFIEQRTGLKTQLVEFVGRHMGLAGDILEFGTRMPFTWRNPDKFRETHWYRFQEAVRSHLTECWGVMLRRFPELAEP